MTVKDFSTMKKTLRIIQNVQATTKVYTLWISFTHYESGPAVGVTIFREESDEKSTSFDFYSFHDAEERFEMYNKMMDFINGK